MTEEEYLAKLQELKALKAEEEGWTPRAIADEVGNAVGGGLIRGGIGLAGLPVDLVNLATQGGQAGLRKLGWMGEENIIPPIPGGSNDIQNFLEEQAGSPIPTARSKPGEYVQAGTAGLVGGVGNKANMALGAISGLLGKGAYDATGNPWAAAAASMVPFGTKAAWQIFRPRVAETTAKNLTRNMTKEDWAATKALSKEFEPFGDMMPAQALPKHTQAGGLAGELAGSSEGTSIVDALVRQQRVPPGGVSQVDRAVGSLQKEAADLYALGDKVKPTRATKINLLRETRKLPKELGVARGGELHKSLTREIDDLRNVLKDKDLTARQLSVHADKLSGKKDFVDGAGPFYPAAASKVAEAAKKTHPALAAADDVIARKKELQEALGRVRIPMQGGLAGTDPGAVAPNTFVAGAGAATGHSLVAGAAIARMARSIVRGNPEKKLAEALSDPTFRKLEALVGSGRLPDTVRNALLAGIQAEMQLLQE